MADGSGSMPKLRICALPGIPPATLKLPERSASQIPGICVPTFGEVHPLCQWSALRVSTGESGLGDQPEMQALKITPADFALK